MEPLSDVIFYSIDKAIRTYRQYAQKQLKKAGYTITIDQWLIIKSILDNPSITQQEISEKVFKDNASVTRIIDLLVKANYLKRGVSGNDRRRSNLKITKEGLQIIDDVQNVIFKNRATALKGISEKNLENVKTIMKAITDNCTK
ncbi:MAG: MarR family transcriptional regulator [Bacteroidetes bacterium]|nr:MarR family transcriptional regulator [Bacteroidota bacterium]